MLNSMTFGGRSARARTTTGHRSFVFQSLLIMCLSAIAMEAISRMDNSSFVAANNAVMQPAYDLVIGRLGN